MNEKQKEASSISSAGSSMRQEKPAKKLQVISQTKLKKSLTGKIKDYFRLLKLQDDASDISARGTLPLEEIYENGLCRVKDDYFVKVIEFFDINYRLAPEETQRHIFDAYCHFLNYFDEKITVQLSFINARTDQKDVDEVISIPEKQDDLQELRNEYAKMLKDQYAKGNNGIARKKYIIVGIHEKCVKDVFFLLGNIDNAVQNDVKRM